MLRIKKDVLSELKSIGLNTTKIRREGILAESTLTKIRNGGQLSWSNINTLCKLLRCQPGDLIEYVDDEENE